MTETEATHKTEEGFGDVLEPWPKQDERFGKTYWGERVVSLALAPGEVISGCLEPREIRDGTRSPYHLWYQRDARLDDGRLSGPLYVKLIMDESQVEDLMLRLWCGLKYERGEWEWKSGPATIEEARELFNKRSDDV